MKTEDRRAIELATFHIGDALCGMNILEVQEINRHLTLTNVPQGPHYVLGVINLRGRIVTVIDLGKKMGLSTTLMTELSRNIIVRTADEYVGFLVDQIADVVYADAEQIELPPANIGGIQGKFFEGVLKTDKLLVGVLNTQEILKDDTE